MKISTILLLISVLHVSAEVYSQSNKLSFEFKDLSLKEAFQQIEAQTEYLFLYNTHEIKNDVRVDMNMKNQRIEKVLDELLKDSGLEYSIRDRHIVLHPKKDVESNRTAQPSKTVSNAAPQQNKISGRVVDKDGFPMPGVTVTVKGKAGVGVATDGEGQYSIECNPNDVLVYSFIGFKTIERVAGDMNRVTVTMEEDAMEMEEVVIVAFGKQKKESVVSSISTVNPNELRVASNNLTTAFAGRMAGVIAYQRSGEPGLDNAEFFIRGVTSFSEYGKKDPLILIDGIEMESNDLSKLNVDDIASFSVMKDANSAALYGARGANGVILVTTKEGKDEKIKVNIRAEAKTSANTDLVKLADPITYMKLYNEAVLTRDPMTPLPFSSDKIYQTELLYHKRKIDPYYPYVDWYDFLIKPRTFNQNITANVNGGGKAVQYYLSARLTHDTGILKESKENKFNNNIDLLGFSLRSNVTIKFTPHTTGMVRFYGTFDDMHGPAIGGEDAFHAARNASPVEFLPIYEADDANIYTDHILFGMSPKGESFTNPYASILSSYKEEKKSMMLAQMEFEHQFDGMLKGLIAKGIFNVKRNAKQNFTRGYKPFYYTPIKMLDDSYKLYCYNPDTGTTWLDYAPLERIVGSYIYAEGRLAYNKVLAEKHDLNFLAVGALRGETTTDGANSIQTSLPKRNIVLSGRAAYGYDRRYFVEFNFGYNGSERFSKNNRFGFFPTMGIGWMVSNEAFMENTKDWLNNLKLKASYGLNGNDQIGSSTDRFFQYSIVNMNAAGYVFGAELKYDRRGISISRYANPLITWEKSKKLNVGMELEMFESFTLLMDFFSDTRENILQTRSDIPKSMGLVTTPQANVGVAQGHGFEAELKYQKNFTQDIYLVTNGNFTYATSKYKVYEEPDYSDAEWRSRIGRKLSQPFGHIAERLFIDEEDIRNSPVQEYGRYMPGDIKYRDINKDGKIDDDDKVPIGLPQTPEIICGAGFTLGIRGFDFSCFFQASLRSSFFIDPYRITPFVGGQVALLQSIADDHWSEDNRNLHAFWPRLSDTYYKNNDTRAVITPLKDKKNDPNSTWWLRDGSFLRLKTAELGYKIPSKHTQKWKMDLVRFYISGENLWLWSKFKMWDVEMAGNGLGYPLQRKFVAGLVVNF